jgi:hypothetical protein
MTGVGGTERERRALKVNCPVCQMELRATSLRRHMEHVHDNCVRVQGPLSVCLFGGTNKYNLSMPLAVKTSCPVIGCKGTATRRNDMRSHFMWRHPNDTIRIIEEGAEPYPKCGLCLKHVRPQSVARHGETIECKRGQELKSRREAKRDAHEVQDIRFTVGDNGLENVDRFCYLGRPMMNNDDDMGAIRHNIKKARKKWQMLAQILAREGARPKIIDGRFLQGGHPISAALRL